MRDLNIYAFDIDWRFWNQSPAGTEGWLYVVLIYIYNILHLCCIYLHFLLWMGSLCIDMYIYKYIYTWGGQGDIFLALIISCHLRHIFPLILIVIYTYLENTEKHKEEKDQSYATIPM